MTGDPMRNDEMTGDPMINGDGDNYDGRCNDRDGNC